MVRVVSPHHRVNRSRAVALTPAEKQRRYRERHKDRPSAAQQIRMLKARVAELEAQLRGEPPPDPQPVKSIDTSMVEQWQAAMGRKG